MQKPLVIDNINYTLFFTFNNKEPEGFILDSRTYNGGMDYFFGCDFSSAYVYLVKKENTPKFIEEINAFIALCESLNIDSSQRDYLESLNDIAFLHKSIENSEYDFFVTDFDMNMCQKESYIHLEKHREFVKKIEKISTLAVYAGASFNDASIFDFTLRYLLRKHKAELKQIYVDSGYPFYPEEFARFDDFQIINNTKNQNIYATFIKLYMANVPTWISSVDYENKFDNSIDKLLEKI